MPRAHDSRLEKDLETDLRRLGSNWRIEREVSVLRGASLEGGRQRLFFPDFALVSDGGRVLVEVVGYWTKDYLDEKRALMHAAGVLGSDPRVVLFRKRIDARALLRACAHAVNDRKLICGEHGPCADHGAPMNVMGDLARNEQAE